MCFVLLLYTPLLSYKKLLFTQTYPSHCSGQHSSSLKVSNYIATEDWGTMDKLKPSTHFFDSTEENFTTSLMGIDVTGSLAKIQKKRLCCCYYTSFQRLSITLDQTCLIFSFFLSSVLFLFFHKSKLQSMLFSFLFISRITKTKKTIFNTDLMLRDRFDRS